MAGSERERERERERESYVRQLRFFDLMLVIAREPSVTDVCAAKHCEDFLAEL